MSPGIPGPKPVGPWPGQEKFLKRTSKDFQIAEYVGLLGHLEKHVNR